jgi:parallel beta-helix repeat protein
MQIYIVNSLKDYGVGSLREGIIYSNSNPKTKTKITFEISGTIVLRKNLPKIIVPTDIEGNLSKCQIPTITIDGVKKYTLLEIENTNNCVINGLCLINGKKSGILINKSSNNTIDNCWIGVDAYSNNCSNKYGILLYKSQNNIIGSNPNVNQQYFSNIISFNKNYGIYLIDSDKNQIQNNIIGLSKNCDKKNPNRGGIYFSNSCFNIVGGKKFIDNTKKVNNPTGSKGTTTPVFVRPLLGNIISGNKNNGINFSQSSNNETYGNFIGTDNTGLLNFGNGQKYCYK